MKITLRDIFYLFQGVFLSYILVTFHNPLLSIFLFLLVAHYLVFGLNIFKANTPIKIALGIGAIVSAIIVIYSIRSFEFGVLFNVLLVFGGLFIPLAILGIIMMVLLIIGDIKVISANSGKAIAWS